MRFNQEIEQTLSFERFGRYRDWALGDAEHALQLYALNMQLSEAFYTPLQSLEVALRNRIHTVMTKAHHDHWFGDEGLVTVETQRDQRVKAEADIRADRKAPTPGRIVAALTFSFWTAMFSPAYENLWQTTLHRIARREDGKGLRRKDFSAPLSRIRVLRNRIAHHEPILHWNLPRHHADIVQMIRWLCPVTADWCVAYSRFDSVYPRAPLVLPRSANARAD